MSFSLDRPRLEWEPGVDTPQRSFPGFPSRRCTSQNVNEMTLEASLWTVWAKRTVPVTQVGQKNRPRDPRPRDPPDDIWR